MALDSLTHHKPEITCAHFLTQGTKCALQKTTNALTKSTPTSLIGVANSTVQEVGTVIESVQYSVIQNNTKQSLLSV